MTDEQKLIEYLNRRLNEVSGQYSELLAKYMRFCNENPCPRCHPKKGCGFWKLVADSLAAMGAAMKALEEKWS